MSEGDSQPKDGRIRLLNLEKELAGPGREEVFVRRDAQLAAIQKRALEELKHPLEPAEYERIDRLREGVVAARKVLRFAMKN
jgi:hypothetical protein